MSRWLIKATDNDPNRIDLTTNKSISCNGDVVEVKPDSFESNEEKHNEVEVRSREADTVFGVDKNEQRPIITIFNGPK